MNLMEGFSIKQYCKKGLYVGTNNYVTNDIA